MRVLFTGESCLFSSKEGVKHVPISKVHNMRVSFANSVHKAQGSEFDVVIIPISKSNKRMLHRNLLYTGITRAKKHVFLVGMLKP